MILPSTSSICFQFPLSDPDYRIYSQILKCLLLLYHYHFQGYHKVKEFVITQHPMKETRDAFWTMLWDHNAQVELKYLYDYAQVPNV